MLGFPTDPLRKVRGVLVFLGSLALYALGVWDRGRLKAAFISAVLGGESRSSVNHWTERFVASLLSRGMIAQALEQLSHHRREGARLVLMSASTDLYVPAIGRALGFDEVICTGVRWEGDRLDGHLTTANRRGAEKARCFEELRKSYPGVATAAYGNAASDLDHLRLADQPLLVNAGLRARRKAAQLGVPCGRWN